MNDKSVKRMLILLIVLGFVMIGSLTIGTSYALLEDQVKDQNTHAVKAGNVSIKLSEYFESINNKMSLMDDGEGLLSDDIYQFNIKNTGTASSLYTLTLKDKVPDNYKGKVLNNKFIKVGLEINGEESGPYNLAEVNNILVSKQKIETKELISFKMRLWLDQRYKYEISDNLDAKTFLKLNVKAEQDLGDNNKNLTSIK